ncbi:MAG: PEP-CTERM sorting domain-containing protein [Armatimonadota bacterium]
MKKIFVLSAILSLAVAPAFASTLTLADFVKVNGNNGSAIGSTWTSGYYNSGGISLNGASTGDFELTFTLQGRNISGGLMCAAMFYGTPVGQISEAFPANPGTQVLIGFDATPTSNLALFYRDGGAVAGQAMASGPTLYAVGNIDGPSVNYYFSQINGRAELWAGATQLLGCANANNGVGTFGFGGSGTYTVSNLEYTSLVVPEPSSIVALLSGLSGLTLIRRKK